MSDMEHLYQQRLARYTTAMRNEQPDRVPIRPFVAEFTGAYAGYTCQQLAHDYECAFAAARRVRRRLRLGRRRAQHAGHLDRHDPGHGPAVLHDAGHRPAGPRGPPVPRAAAGRRLDETGRVRRADRRSDRLSVQRVAAAGGRAAEPRGRTGDVRAQPVADQRRDGADAVLPSLGRARVAAAERVRHGPGPGRHAPRPAGFHRRQAPRLPGAGRGPV